MVTPQPGLGNRRAAEGVPSLDRTGSEGVTEGGQLVKE